MASIRDAYQDYMVALLQQAGIDDAQEKAKRVYALEKKIAQAQASIIGTPDAHNAQVWTRADFAAKAPGLDWDPYFKAAGLDGQAAFTSWQPGAITTLSQLVASRPRRWWKEWAA